MDYSHLIVYSLAGLFVGAVVGITGVGGGSLMTPILTAGFGLPAHLAVGTDLAFAATTKSVGTLVHGISGNIQWHAVRWLLAGSLPAALLTIWMLHTVGTGSAQTNHAISKIIGFSVLLTAVSLVFRPRLQAWLAAHPQFVLSTTARGWTMLVGGVIIGALVTVSSIGAGAIGATFLLLVNPEWKPSEVAGTDIAYAVPLTLVAGIGHAALGTVNGSLLVGLLLGSIPGIAVGSYASKHLSEPAVRAVLIAALSFAGIKLIS